MSDKLRIYDEDMAKNIARSADLAIKQILDKLNTGEVFNDENVDGKPKDNV